MSMEHATGTEQHAALVLRENWLWLVLLGSVLILAGVGSIAVPAISDYAASRVLGSVLISSGIVQLLQSAKMGNWMGNWMGFMWHMLLGILATAGGVLIYMDPFSGVLALTMLIALVFAVHGCTQIAFATKIRNRTGWRWFLVSGCIALIAAAVLMMKLPYTHSFTPATVAGTSLIFAGWAYIAMALTARKSPSSP